MSRDPGAVPLPSSPASLSIGQVLERLRPEFPDVSISKIRFLEAEGLITPARRDSGYRSFAPRDVERLRYILTAQRDRFWPLKVIRESLDALDRGLQPSDPGGAARTSPSVPEPAGDPSLPTAEDLRSTSDLRLTPTELRQASGLDGAAYSSLQTFGLLTVDAEGYHREHDLTVARHAASLATYGIEARHLRLFRVAADREIGLVQQVLEPVRRRAARGADVDPAATQADVLAHAVALHVALVRAGIDVRR